MKKTIFRLPVILSFELLLTLALALGLAGLAYKMSWEDAAIGGGVAAICVLTNLSGGILVGKIAKSRRFLWGALGGILYFFASAAVAWMVTRVFYDSAVSMLPSAALCMTSQMAGGMLGGWRSSR